MKYYCSNCKIYLEIFNSIAIPKKVTDSAFQIKKFFKHTGLTTSAGKINSIFRDTSTVTYRDYIISTVSLGCLEIDNWDRYNLIWETSTSTGQTYEEGKFPSLNSGIKVVCISDMEKIHAYPYNYEEVRFKTCQNCGKPI